MARKTDKTTITFGDGRAITFHVTQVGSRVGYRTLLLLAKSVIPAMKLAGGAVSKLRALKAAGGTRAVFQKILDLDTDNAADAAILQALVDGVGRLVELLKPEDFDAIVEALLLSGTVQVQSGKGSKAELSDLDADLYDDLFAGAYLQGFRLIGFALKVNYVSFSAARSALGITEAEAGDSSGSATSST